MGLKAIVIVVGLKLVLGLVSNVVKWLQRAQGGGGSHTRALICGPHLPVLRSCVYKSSSIPKGKLVAGVGSIGIS